jgi:hypothetical protein
MATVQRFCCAIACAAAILLSGCGTIEQAQQTIRGVFRPPSVAAANTGMKRVDQITVEELDQVRLTQVSAIYDIVTNADPFTRLLDLMLVVTLQSQKWIEEDQAERWFGDRAQPSSPLRVRRARTFGRSPRAR